MNKFDFFPITGKIISKTLMLEELFIFILLFLYTLMGKLYIERYNISHHPQNVPAGQNPWQARER
jgi:hypothetical protein